MNKSMVIIKSSNNGKTYRIPADVYDILMNEKYDDPQKAFLMMNWYKTHEAEHFGFDDIHVEILVLGMFKNIINNHNDYNKFIHTYFERYGKVMKYNTWDEEYRDADFIRQIMYNHVRNAMDEGKSEKEIRRIVKEKMKPFEETENIEIKKLLSDPSIIGEQILNRKNDLEYQKLLPKCTVSTEPLPFVNSNGKPFIVI